MLFLKTLKHFEHDFKEEPSPVFHCRGVAEIAKANFLLHPTREASKLIQVNIPPLPLKYNLALYTSQCRIEKYIGRSSNSYANARLQCFSYFPPKS